MSRATLREPDIPRLDHPGGLVGEAALSLYGAAGRAAEPLLGVLLARRERRGKEDGARRAERLGRASHPRPAGRLAWVHGASVGETVAVLPLIAELRRRDLAVLLTTGTVTAAQVAEQRLPPGATHQYMPVDTPGSLDRFLDHWHPDLAIFAESELWPTTLAALGRRAMPLAVVNARMSERSARNWRCVPPLARAVLGRVDLWLAQTADDAARLAALGACDVVVCGNLKYDAPPPPADAAAVEELRRAAGDRFVFLAASTHPGEEAAILNAHRQMIGTGARVLTVLAPRHPDRGDQLAADIVSAGLVLRRRSCGEAIEPTTDIYLADTIGEMGLWYRLADAAFLGGSLVKHGGQNPIEPAKLGVPVLHGPHIENFRDVYEALATASAVSVVGNGGRLAEAVRALLQDRGERERLARNARDCVERSAGALRRTLDALQPLLAASGERHAVPRP